MHTGSDSRTTAGSIAETEMGSAQDMLALYEAPSGNRLGTVVARDGGRRAKSPKYAMVQIQNLHAAVEEAAKSTVVSTQ
jgi:hypothetical protein